MKADLSKLPEPKPRRGSRHRKLPGPSKRTIEQREADLAYVADALVRGHAQRAMAEGLTAIRPYKVSRDIVCKDIAEVTKRWRTLCLGDVDAMKAEHLAKLLALERKAWERIEALEKGAARDTARKTVYTAKTRTSNSASRTTEKRDTTAVWLRALQYAMSERAKILGLYAPLKLDAKGANLNFGNVTNNHNLGVSVTITTERPIEELAAFEIIDATTLPDDPDEPSEA